ncbi:MAG: urease accessory protein UreE [Nocardiopsis sp. BM-2018]|nr:MAG: urease accessory protein UreE [Nocardiopsis sp. BM-2018]
MTDLPPAARLLRAAPGTCYDVVVLDYDARLMRRKRLVTARDQGFMVDLPEVTNLDPFWGFELEDGRCIRIIPAEEAVLVITGDLPRLAWHIGNRHTPCQIEAARLIIREDHVLERMLQGLGATIARAHLPFTPEGGAYGHGRTMGHDHGHAHARGHAHAHAHGHAHGHAGDARSG